MAEPRRNAANDTGDLAGVRMLVVEARFYDDIADALLAGATRALEAAGVVFERVSVPGSLEEASMDLGANRAQTFLYVTLPAISTALVSGALLAFALSFDEVIVTTFTAGAQTTLPIWIFGNLQRGQQLPEVNVVVLIVLAATVVPVLLAQRLTRESGILRTE